MSDVAEEMLSKDWVASSIGAVAEDTQIGIVRSKALQNVGRKGIPYLKMNNVTMDGLVTTDDLVYVEVSDEELEKYTIQEGDILFNTRNSTELVGKTGFANKSVVGFVFNNNLMRIRIKEGIEPKYVAYQMVSPTFRKNMEKVKRATTNIAAVYAKDLLPLPIYLAPPEQQKRIVAKIEELFSHIDAGIEALKKAKHLLKQYRQSVFKAAVTGELTKEWREANKDKLEPASKLLERIIKERRQKWEEQQLEQFKAKGKIPKDEKWKEKYKEPLRPIPRIEYEIPESWCLVSVGQVSWDTLIGLVRSNNLQSDEPIGSPYLKMNNIDMNGNINIDDIVYVEVTDEERVRYALKEDDILFNTRNSVELVGKTAMATNMVDGFVFNNNIMKIRLSKSAFPKFIAFQMCSSNFRKEMEKVKRATTSIAAVYGKDLFPLPLVLPPIDEQILIAGIVKAKLDAIERLSDELSVQLKRSEKNKQSILASAFSGTLLQ
jgi:type I restriction enzyme, S subunit